MIDSCYWWLLFQNYCKPIDTDLVVGGLLMTMNNCPLLPTIWLTSLSSIGIPLCGVPLCWVLERLRWRMEGWLRCDKLLECRESGCSWAGMWPEPTAAVAKLSEDITNIGIKAIHPRISKIIEEFCGILAYVRDLCIFTNTSHKSTYHTSSTANFDKTWYVLPAQKDLAPLRMAETRREKRDKPHCSTEELFSQRQRYGINLNHTSNTREN